MTTDNAINAVSVLAGRSDSSELILASASPRRQELLTQIGVRYRVCPVDIDERPRTGETPRAYVLRLARDKARRGFSASATAGWALGSDTTVVCEEQILGKPQDAAHACAMLELLSGRTHQVLTAVALAQGERLIDCVVQTDVTFRPISREEIAAYWASGEPADKAGGYGIQGFGAVFVAHLAGSYSAVVGLPLQETAQLLRQAGVTIWSV